VHKIVTIYLRSKLHLPGTAFRYHRLKKS